MKIFLSVLSFLVLFSCSGKKEEIPAEILSKEKFISVMIEMYMTEAKLSHSNIIDSPTYKKGIKEYETIFKKFETDKSQVEKSIDYYTRQPELMREIQSRVLDSLNLRSIK
jgi:hypothetical protein